jgi:hypothetical protein
MASLTVAQINIASASEQIFQPKSFVNRSRMV